jgi:hypothetical protein
VSVSARVCSLVCSFVCCLFSFLSVLTHTSVDVAFLTTSSNPIVADWSGGVFLVPGHAMAQALVIVRVGNVASRSPCDGVLVVICFFLRGGTRVCPYCIPRHCCGINVCLCGRTSLSLSLSLDPTIDSGLKSYIPSHQPAKRIHSFSMSIATTPSTKIAVAFSQGAGVLPCGILFDILTKEALTVVVLNDDLDTCLGGVALQRGAGPGTAQLTVEGSVLFSGQLLLAVWGEHEGQAFSGSLPIVPPGVVAGFVCIFDLTTYMFTGCQQFVPGTGGTGR